MKQPRCRLILTISSLLTHFIIFNDEELDDGNSVSPKISNVAFGSLATDKCEQEFCAMSKSKEKFNKVRLQNEVPTR